jgi:Superinfection immunity protein
MFHIPAFAVLLALYFLPTIIASGRHLPERTGIAMLNLFLGWTFFGWVVALIWAITAPTPYVVYVQPPYPPRYR